MRSLLFVPADSPRKLAKAGGAGADALILDLEDSVALARKDAARDCLRRFASGFTREPGGPELLVRVNALDSADIEADLDVVAEIRPDAVVLPKSRGGADVQRLGVKLAVREAQIGADDGKMRVLAIATESGASIFGLPTYANASRRLIALAWGAEDLSADIGAEANRTAAGRICEPFRLARNLLLFAAAAACVDAIDGIYPRFRDEAGLRAECEEARRDGFVGKLAIHPDQVAAINEIFTPSPAAVQRARDIVAAFAAQAGAGAVSLNGEMLDRPHLRRAERLLRRCANP